MVTRADSSEVVVLHLAQLIDRFGDGRLHIPRFQRPLVWDWERKRELLRSVRDGVPIGSMMIWRTHNEQVPVQASLAGHRLPGPRPNIPREYLLDGLQRLSTLYVALRGPGKQSDTEDEDESSSRVGYDLRLSDFVEFEDEAEGILPLDVLGSAVTLLKVQRVWTGPDADSWLERSDELARAFREYQVPVVTIVSNDVELATRTFKMINSQGAKMGEADMVHALAWTENLAVRERIEELRQEHLEVWGWGDIDNETILRVVKADASIDLYDRTAEALSQRIKDDPRHLDSAVERLAWTAKVFADLGICSWALVPYNFQAVFIANALNGVEPTKEVERSLGDWVWLTTYGEMFAGISGHRIAQALKELRETVRDGQLRWSGAKEFRLRPLPRKADFRSVRVKAFALRLAQAQAQAQAQTQTQAQAQIGLPYGDLDAFMLLAIHGREMFVKLLDARQTSRANSYSPANRFLCSPAQRLEWRRRILEADIDDALAAAHLIPPASIEAAKAGDWDRFVTERLAFIEAQERAFVDEICARHGITVG